MENVVFLQRLIYDYSYMALFLLTTAYFLFLYFGLAPIFQYVCRWLHKSNVLQRIVARPVSSEQIRFEIGNSLRSIVIFGFSSWPLVYLIRKGVITLLPDSVFNVVAGLIILTLWNEVHFFIIHRTMHLQFFMRRVHTIHHRSVVPTVYAVYSFHWFEALMLSTVSLTIAPFVSFSPVAIGLYPLVSVLLNYAGHCNYRFGAGNGAPWKTLGTRHAEHHVKQSKNYGFASHLLDWLTSFYDRQK